MAEITATFEATIEMLLEQKKFNSLKDILTTMYPADIAILFEGLPKQKLTLLFRLLPKELAAEVFVEMESHLQQLLITGFSDKELKEIIDELYMDDAVDLIEEMPANVVKRILSQADPETRRLINEMLMYPEDSAGSIMTTEFVDLRPEMTASDAVDHIRATGIDKETIDVCYVTDTKRKLVGAISIRTIILAAKDTKISEIMDPHVISVNTHEDQEAVAQIFAKYGFTAIPVVDTENRLVGIVTVDDAIDVMQEETTEDISKMAAITPPDKPYFQLSVFEIWKSRIPWLLLLMISATFTGMIISSFEKALATYIVLTAFIPMLMDTGGNSGSQASVTIIRGLSLQQIQFSDILRVVWKEARVAVMCAITLSVFNFAKLMLFDRVGLYVALVICITLSATVFVAKIVGCILPMLAKKIGFDPAVMASPFITTIVDALSLIIYFSTASVILGI
ncbi:magnesium transporter [Clostridium thermosuccinogenes]|jgi:magnesium transporter|uniref:Magnesium transporter MgtE n=1 Tax=Clostridium thermosuccinogenes TaxID=84032 RepID=A0A2K2FL19_9CLOT|nr:magnesium transporter [Pseudoclostridium thermosuccinogenes]AUS97580.1 magnesium transporter [Pseudoclostridium thermosuccinogenes]PNT97444.1 magnesium transporter [Pseudoclostridium thermosuccinogenes]PNT99476.1 magnesium transporter [Pseudoclostridium thermosuccinogenes]